MRATPLVFVMGVGLAAGCGSTPGPSPPPPPPVQELSIACPTSLMVEVPAQTALVTYPAPATTGGTAPITVECSKASGSVFDGGLTRVTCNAGDSIGRAATCSFNVTVTPVPTARGTNYLSAGDSITNGEVSPPRSPSANMPADAYPAVLRRLLQERYKQQTITLDVLAADGRTATETEEALRVWLQTRVPDALLILAGVNDINSGDPDDIQVVADALTGCVRRARTAGVKIVFLSNLLPQTSGPNAHAPQLIVPTNAAIASVAAREGAVLVDNYAALVMAPSLYIGVDGLHPTVAGHRRIAETFFESIKVNFELPLAPGPATPARLGSGR